MIFYLTVKFINSLFTRFVINIFETGALVLAVIKFIVSYFFNEIFNISFFFLLSNLYRKFFVAEIGFANI